MNRRHVLAAGGIALLTSPSLAQSVQKPLLPPLESFPLWPEGLLDRTGVTVVENWIIRNPKDNNPNDTAATHVTDPILMVRRPKISNGAAFLIIPGGGYQRVAVSRAGSDMDEKLAQAGFTVFIMTYRLPADNWQAGPEAPLQDAQRAISLIRHRAKEYGIDPNRVGVIGGSAGGHLAGWLSVRYEKRAYAAIDAADTQSIRPDITALLFPVLTMFAPYAHKGSVNNLFPKGATEDQKQALSIERNLLPNMAPVFVAHASDDPVVPVENSLMMFSALKKNRTLSELHVFDQGGHGLSVNGQGQPWQPLFLNFANRRGFCDPVILA